ncbi:phage antirepressor KilAC domain-containing protein [Ligilactobacillus ruminis]|uniref:phage antirepressor KilAC domain-containing protein n=1 Tax=Ligilactobacillus ruminis TaxID=1623 RepID=UPI0034A4FD10
MDLIKVMVKNDQQLVSAREVLEKVGLKTRFSRWVDQNFGEFEEGVDFTSVKTFTVVNNGARRELDDYALTLDMAKELCMMARTDAGKELRRYFIELERKWNDPQEVVKRGYAILQNENTQLKIEVKRMKPKALFADAVSTSDTPILVGELAKILHQNGVSMGQNRMFRWLRDNGYLISKKGTSYNMPTQRAMELGLFKIKENAITHSDGHVTITKTPKVTGKGQVYFVNKFVQGLSS